MKLIELVTEKKKFAVLVGIVIIIIAAVVFSTVGITQSNTEKTAQVQGVVEAKEISINTKIAGRIVKVYTNEGTEVKAGDILVQISSDELEAKKTQVLAQIDQAQAGVAASEATVRQAQSGVAAAQAVVDMARAGYNAAREKVTQAQAGISASQKQRDAASAVNDKAQNGARTQELAQAESAYNLWKSTYARAENLYQGCAISAQKLDEIKTQMSVAEETYNMAKEGARTEDKAAANAQLGMAEAGITSSNSLYAQAQEGANAALSQLNQAQAGLQAAQSTAIQADAGLSAAKGKLEQAQGGLDEINAYLEDTFLKAPIDGTVTAMNSEEGELVSTGTSIGTVSNLDTCWVTVNVDENKLKQINEGQSVEASVSAYPKEKFTGTIVTINKQPDFATKKATNENGNFDIVSYGVKIELENSAQKIRPGMSVTVKLDSFGG